MVSVPPGPGANSKKNRAIRILPLGLGVLLADQATKAWALWSLSELPTLPIVPGVFHLTLTHNPGVAFGLLRGYGLAVTLGTLLILLGLGGLSLRKGCTPSRPLALSFGLILGGAVGNLIDRLRFGGVVDFLDFRVWPIFNVADACITVGALLMAWNLLKRRR